MKTIVDLGSSNDLVRRLDFRVTTSEHALLAKYCKLTRRSKSDVLREIIRTLELHLEEVGKKSPSDIGAILPLS